MGKRMDDKFELRGHMIPNRICVPAMHMACANPDGTASARNIAHYRKLAAGGAGLIIQEATCVAPDGILRPKQLGCWSDAQIPGLRQIAQAVHEAGGVIVAQIHHAGLIGYCTQVGPSAYPAAVGEKATRALTAQEIDALIEAFAAGAERIYRAGYDGVELHGCHSYLISQFFNRRVNRRTDRYADAMQFVKPILERIRARVPEQFLLGIRLGAYEPELADGIAHARALDAAGVDFLDISYGFDAQAQPECPPDWPYADVIWAAGEIKKQVSVPVFAVYGIRTAQAATDVLARTDVDMVDVGRAHLANAAWASEALAWCAAH